MTRAGCARCHRGGREQVGIADPEATSIRRSLEVLVGRVVERNSAVKWVGDHPETAEEPINAPVFLTRLPRSGTTFFQYLFDNGPRFRLIRSWAHRLEVLDHEAARTP
jgi:hypothetical protein